MRRVAAAFARNVVRLLYPKRVRIALEGVADEARFRVQQ